MQTRIAARRGIAHELLLPGSCDQMHGSDPFPREQASRQADGMPLDA
jgi:hypothetical protein